MPTPRPFDEPTNQARATRDPGAPAEIAGRLLAWTAAGGAAIDAGRDPDAVVAAAAATIETGSDGHRVVGLPGELPGAGVPGAGVSGVEVPLVEALRLVLAAGVVRAALAFPQPGDPLGVGASSEFGAAATEAGAGVALTTRRLGDLGWVPHRDERGSSYHGWRWQVVVLPPAPAPALPAEPLRLIDQAERGLRRAMRAAGDELAELDLARWRPEAAAGRERATAALRRHVGGLPAGWPPAARALTNHALALWRALAVVLADEGAASASAAQLRAAALSDLSHAVREAVVVSFGVPAAMLLHHAGYPDGR